jgi:hypothetical protein
MARLPALEDADAEGPVHGTFLDGLLVEAKEHRALDDRGAAGWRPKQLHLAVDALEPLRDVAVEKIRLAEEAGHEDGGVRILAENLLALAAD